MPPLREWLRRISYLLNRRRRDEALQQEMEAHREMMTDPRRFGNVGRHREAAADVWGWQWLDDVARDVRFAARTLLRAPGFTLVTIASLALATGATTAIFSIVHSVLLRPLPFDAPDRLVQVQEIHRVGGAGFVSFADLEAFRQQSTLVGRFSGYELTARLLETSEGSERLTTVFADRDFFSLLGVNPVAGRGFDASDPATVAVISASLWERRFARDPAVVGRTIALSGNRWDPVERRSVLQRRELTIIGVMPERFQFPYGAGSGFPGATPESRIDLWIPYERPPGRLSSVTARLEPGVGVEAAAAELDIIEKRLDVTNPDPYRPTGVQVTPLAQDVLGGVGRSLWLLFGAVALVLAAACANVANLLLARTTARTHEVVTRAALGASPHRLVRQFLVESLLLSLAGGAVGAAVAWWGVDLLTAIGAARIPRTHEIRLDWLAFLFLLAVSVLTAVLFGLAPALIASRADGQSITKESGGRATVSSRYARIRDALVVAEVALAFVLAFGVAGVMRELGRLEGVDSGMNIRDVVSLHLTPRMADHDYFALEERVRQIPGVESAGFIQMVPLQNWGWIGNIHIEGRPPEERPIIELRTITPGYFQTLGIPVRGRLVTEGDTLGPTRSIMVNDAFARLHFPGQEAIGRATDRGTIVGVVGDVRQAGLDRPAVPEIYAAVNRESGFAPDLGISLLVRSRAPLESIFPAIRAAVRQTNPVVAIFRVKTMEQVVSDSLWELNLYRWSIGLFALLALVLAAIGLFGVISYNVSSRMREFAIRLVLGSNPADLARLVLGRAVRLAATGLVLGAFCALATLPLLRKLPAAIDPDAATFAIIAGLLLAVAVVSCLVPAIRVRTLNPASALRRDQ